MSDLRFEPPAPPPPAPSAPMLDSDEDFHCENCLYLPDPITKGEGFWACQNLCVRD